VNLLKPIEKKVKQILSGTLRFFLEQPTRKPGLPINKVLFIRYGGLGDMLLSIPVFKQVKVEHPETEIDILCDKKNVSPIDGVNIIANIFFYEKSVFRTISLIKTLRKRKYDYIINLIVYPSFTFSLISRFAGKNSVRVAADQEEFSFYYNRILELPPKREIHMLDRLFILSGDLIQNKEKRTATPWIEYNSDIKSEADKIYETLCSELKVNPADAKIATINLSAGLKRREWQSGKYKNFLEMVVPKYSDNIDGWVVFTDPKKPEESKSLVNSLNQKSVIQIKLIKDFRIIIELIRKFYLLVTPDTSILHAASAMGTPTLALIIGENAKTWPPVGNISEVVVSKDPLSLNELPVDEVVNGFDSLIKKLQSK
jgi:ADP-heptose:LPS heptosyltransferase